jgi:hypothetical protein
MTRDFCRAAGDPPFSSLEWNCPRFRRLLIGWIGFKKLLK